MLIVSEWSHAYTIISLVCEVVAGRAFLFLKIVIGNTILFLFLCETFPSYARTNSLD